MKRNSTTLSIKLFALASLFLFLSPNLFSQATTGYALTANAGGAGCGAHSMVEIDLATGAATCLGAITPTFPAASCCPTGGAIKNGLMYFLDINQNTGLYTVTTDGNVTVTAIGGTNPPGGGGHGWQSLDWAPNGLLYGLSTNVSTSRLYTIDPNTGAATLVGAIPGVNAGIWLAIDGSGTAYVADILSDRLFQIDLATGNTIGAGVPITDGVNPINLNFAQAASFSCGPGGMLFGTLFNSNTFTAQFGIIDPATGVFTLTQDFGLAQFSAFAIPVVLVPTLGQWGLIILSLLMMSIVMVFSMAPKMATANGQTTSTKVTLQNFTFDKNTFFKTWVGVALATVLGFVTAMNVFGYELTGADPIGAFVASGIVAYMITKMKK